MDLKEYVIHGRRSTSDAESQCETDSFFDCNICLEYPRDPVITLCGHLYCWSCIYKWFHVQSASLDSDEHPQCPVCKADVSHTTVVPLYGRGRIESETERTNGVKSPYQSTPIPPRPSASNPRSSLFTTTSSGQQLVYRNPYRDHNHESNESDSSPSVLSYSGTMTTSHSHPVIWMFREMMNARMFVNNTSLQTSGLGSMRRDLQTENSLNRISVFLLFSVMLFLILF